MTTTAPGRLIPAHAGKTALRATLGIWREAHPRSRGENSSRRPRGQSSTGSSPLTRGKLWVWASAAGHGRLIPAHAGKTGGSMVVMVHYPAHPRSRGENSHSDVTPDVTRGSSPLTRGKHFLTCVFIAQIGQILESLELCASSESYSSQDAYATGAPQDQVRSIGLVPRSSRDAS